MKEPRRWLDSRNNSPEAELLRAVAEEPCSSAALHRACRRFGVSGAWLSVTSGGLATAAAAQTVAVGAKTMVAGAGVGAAGRAVALAMAFGKAVVSGLGVGTLMVGTAYWTTHERSAAISNASGLVPIAANQTPARMFEPDVAPEAPGVNASGSHDLELDPPIAVDSIAAPSARLAMAENTGRVPQPKSSMPMSPRVEGAPAVARFSDEPEKRNAIPLKTPQPTEAEVPSPIRRGSGLAREVRALDSARQALRSGDARRALDELDRSEQERIFQMLSREAAVLRVEALGALGQTERAATLARRWLARGVSPSQKKSLERWVDAAKP